MVLRFSLGYLGVVPNPSPLIWKLPVQTLLLLLHFGKRATETAVSAITLFSSTAMLPLKRQKAGLRMSLGKFLKVMGRGEVDGH